jgi:hypothetical protein
MNLRENYCANIWNRLKWLCITSSAVKTLLDLCLKISYLSELTVTELWQPELVEETLLPSGKSRLLTAQTHSL